MPVFVCGLSGREQHLSVTFAVVSPALGVAVLQIVRVSLCAKVYLAAVALADMTNDESE